MNCSDTANIYVYMYIYIYIYIYILQLSSYTPDVICLKKGKIYRVNVLVIRKI